MTDRELELMKRFEHYLYDAFHDFHKLLYLDCKDFEEYWKRMKRYFQTQCYSPNWEQRCKNWGLTKFAPYTEAAIDLKLTIYGY